MFCAFCVFPRGLQNISRNRDGVDWYSIDQSQDLAQFIVDEGMANIRPVSAPMPDRIKELLSNPNEVSLTEHKWIRSTVGSLRVTELFCNTFAT